MRTISGLISEFNSADKSTAGSNQLLGIARWITSIVNTFGLNGSARPDDGSIGWSGIRIPDYARFYLNTISSTRDALRKEARSGPGSKEQIAEIINHLEPNGQPPENAEAAPYQAVLSTFQNDLSSLPESVFGNDATLSKEILKLCDRIRDVELWNLGIYLEDRTDGQPALVRPVTRELRAAKAEQEAKEEQKRKAKEERENEARERADKGRMSHLQMFRTAEYSAWDDEGFPLKDSTGGELVKSKSKKLKKEYDRQKKLHEAWQKANSPI